MKHQKKFELNDTGRKEAIAYAKEKTKETGRQYYVIASGALDGKGHYVEDEPGMIRPAFENQVYPEA